PRVQARPELLQALLRARLQAVQALHARRCVHRAPAAIGAASSQCAGGVSMRRVASETADKVLYSVADGIATITLNDPDTRNALSPELLGGLIASFERARDDEDVRCVVLRSSHEKTFSSGANLGGFSAEAPLVHKHFATERFVGLFKL